MTLHSGDHVFVTGGTGLIGHRLCHHLVQAGCRVTVLTRDVDRARRRLSDDCALVEAITELDDYPPVKAVVNLAGEPLAAKRWNRAFRETLLASRVGLTHRLFDYFSAAASPPTVLVSGSAIGFYGPHGDETLDETGAQSDCFSSRLCRDWEAAAREFEALDTRVCLLRTGVVLDPGEGALASMLPAFRLGLGGPMGSGRQWFSWIHRDDIVRLIAFLLEEETLSGPVNATAPEPATNREFSRALAGVLGRPAVLRMPAPVVRALFGQMAEELLLSGQRVVPRRALDAGFAFRYSGLGEALDDLFGGDS